MEAGFGVAMYMVSPVEVVPYLTASFLVGDGIIRAAYCLENPIASLPIEGIDYVVRNVGEWREEARRRKLSSD